MFDMWSKIELEHSINISECILYQESLLFELYRKTHTLSYY